MCFLKVERGTITKGAEVEIVGLGDSFKTTITGIGVLDSSYQRVQQLIAHVIRH